MARIVGGSVTDSIPGTGNGGWRSRIVGHGEEAPDQLLANPGNWRIHGKAQQEALAGVLDEVGWVQDVIVNQRTGHMIDGHLRVTLAMRHNEPMIPVVYVDLAPEEEALVLATLDPLSAMATTDAAQYDALLRDVDAQSAAVQEMLVKTAADAGLYGERFQSDKNMENVDDAWGVVIMCDSEQEQSLLLERFLAEGLKCQAFMS